MVREDRSQTAQRIFDASASADASTTQSREFKYCVLEVKIPLTEETIEQGGADESVLPGFLQRLLDAELVIHAGKFSKYLLGCTLLHAVDVVPAWAAAVSASAVEVGHTSSTSVRFGRSNYEAS